MSTYSYTDRNGETATGEFWSDDPTGIPGHSGCKWLIADGRCVLVGVRRSDRKLAEVVSLDRAGQSIEVVGGEVVVKP